MKTRQGKPRRPRALARLDAERKAAELTLEAIAVEAAKTAKTKTCSIPTVSKALSGDSKNANVVATVRRLLAEKKSSAAA